MNRAKASAADELLYDRWDKHWEGEPRLTFLGRMMYPPRIEATKKAVRSLDVKSAIDVGCGFGHTLAIFKKLGLDYDGIDVSPKSVAVCKDKSLNARLGKLEEETNTYDLVASEGMLEHFLNFEPYAAHMARIAKKYVLLIQPNHDSFTGKTLVYLAQLIRGSKIVFEYNYRIGDFISVFEKNGFKAVRNEPLFFDTSRLLVFERK